MEGKLGVWSCLRRVGAGSSCRPCPSLSGVVVVNVCWLRYSEPHNTSVHACDVVHAGMPQSPLCQLNPLLCSPCRSGAGAAAAHAVVAASGPSKPRLDEVMCVLEVLASMTLVSEVVDAALVGNEPMQQVRSGMCSCCLSFMNMIKFRLHALVGCPVLVSKLVGAALVSGR